MAITLATAKFHERGVGRDALHRAMAWQQNALAHLAANRALTAAGAARGTTAKLAKTVNTVTYTIGGKFFSLAGSDDFWTPAGATVAASSWQKYALLVDDAGAASVQEATQSTVSAAAVPWTNVTAAAKANPQNPWAALIAILNAGKVIVATATVATDATHTFIPGTTNFNATGITTTFADGFDLALLPVLANSTGLLYGLSL